MKTMKTIKLFITLSFMLSGLYVTAQDNGRLVSEKSYNKKLKNE